MRQDSYPDTLDPRLLSLHEHPITPTNIAYAIPIAHEDVDDDIAIACGQVDSEDGIGSLGIHEATRLDGHGSLAAELELSDNFDNGHPQAFSAPPRFGSFSGFHSGFTPGWGGSSLSVDPEPWNHLKQTFAISVSHPDGRSSRESQIDACSSRSSDLLGPCNSRPAAHTFNPRFQHRRRTFASDQATKTTRVSPQSQNFQAATVQTPSLSQLRRQESSRHDQGRAESSISSTSSPTPFPDLEIEDIPSQSSYSNAVYTRHDRSLSKGKQEGIGGNTGILGGGLDEAPQELDMTLAPAWYTTSHDQMGPYGDHWRQKQSLSSVGNLLLDSDATPHATPDHQHSDNELHHSNAIMIPRLPAASEHYDSNISSSFPTTAGFFPPNVAPISPNPQPAQARQIQRRRRETDSALRPTSLPMRRKASNKSTKAARSGSLSTIREDYRNLVSISPPSKGKRVGPLSQGTREEAKEKRINKNVCIKCHKMKSKCEGKLPCEGCRRNLNAKPGAHPCMRSYFFGLVEQGTLNAIFQDSICHPSPDGQGSLTFRYPSTFNVGELLGRLEIDRYSYNIMVTTWIGSSYTVDLARFFGILSRFWEHESLETCKLDDFMDNRFVRVSEWLECMEYDDQNLNVLDQSINFNDMPSRNSYHHLPLGGAEYARPLSIYNDQDVESILFAAQINRIILRALELEAYGALQRSISEFHKLKDDAALKLLNGQLARLIVSLRWRMAWWASFGHPFEPSQESRIALTERVRMLTHVLYCYFFITKKKLGSRDNSLPHQARSLYGHSVPALGDLPDDDSAEGFNSWMQSGQVQLQQSRGINIPRSH